MEDKEIVLEEEKKEEAVIPPAENEEEKVELNSDPVPAEEPAPEPEPAPVEQTELAPTDIPGVEEKPSIPMFTQEQMNEKIGSTRVETREKTFKYVYDRYGVENEEQMDELFNNAQRYDTLKESYDAERAEWDARSAARDAELAEIKEQVALMQSGIDDKRYEDAKLILRGKGLEVNLENIENELATHPEWKKNADTAFVKREEENPEPVSKISVLGNSKDVKPANPELDERAQARKLFDL